LSQNSEICTNKQANFFPCEKALCVRFGADHFTTLNS
jgi:hypothetical protein